MKHSMLLLTAALAILALPTEAWSLSATQSVLKEVTTVAADGSESTQLVEAVLVVPGETVVYRLDYINDSDDAVDDMVLTMPVPAEIEFQDGSAERDGTAVLYSADGGETYRARDELMFVSSETGARPAQAGEITHVRWTFEESVPPGGTGNISFAGTLR